MMFHSYVSLPEGKSHQIPIFRWFLMIFHSYVSLPGVILTSPKAQDLKPPDHSRPLPPRCSTVDALSIVARPHPGGQVTSVCGEKTIVLWSENRTVSSFCEHFVGLIIKHKSMHTMHSHTKWYKKPVNFKQASDTGPGFMKICLTTLGYTTPAVTIAWQPWDVRVVYKIIKVSCRQFGILSVTLFGWGMVILLIVPHATKSLENKWFIIHHHRIQNKTKPPTSQQAWCLRPQLENTKSW